VNIKRQIYYAHRQKKYVSRHENRFYICQNWVHCLHFSENSQRHHYAVDASVYLVDIKRQIYYTHPQKNMLVVMSIIFIIYMLLSENWFHFLKNSQRHHYAADASVYLVNIKRQIYYTHRPKEYVSCHEDRFYIRFCRKIGFTF
jgi:hypothetical protein